MVQIAYITTSALHDWATYDPPLTAALPLGTKVNGARKIRLKTFVEWLEHIGNMSKRPGIAWGIGQMVDYSTRGKVGRVALGAKTLGSALCRLSDYFSLIQDATELRLFVSGNWATLSYKILDPDIWPRTQDALYSLGIYSSLLKAAAPDAWGQVAMTVETTQARAGCDLGAIVKTSVTYGGDTNCLQFPANLLDCTLDLAPAADRRTLAELSRYLVWKRRRMTMSSRVRHLIFRDLGKCEVNQEILAREVGVSARTLRRHLASEKLSFQDLLDDCRMRLAALDFATRRTVSLSELALRLGYSEHSTFSRAFVRWAGVPPQEYRASL